MLSDLNFNFWVVKPSGLSLSEMTVVESVSANSTLLLIIVGIVVSDGLVLCVFVFVLTHAVVAHATMNRNKIRISEDVCYLLIYTIRAS